VDGKRAECQKENDFKNFWGVENWGLNSGLGFLGCAPPLESCLGLLNFSIYPLGGPHVFAEVGLDHDPPALHLPHS
jgi:hypothetical protein